MKKKTLYCSLTCARIVPFPLSATAQMGSENYTIPTSVFSGGGGPMGSTSFDTDATVGQSSPLMGPTASSENSVSANFAADFGRTDGDTGEL